MYSKINQVINTLEYLNCNTPVAFLFNNEGRMVELAYDSLARTAIENLIAKIESKNTATDDTTLCLTVSPRTSDVPLIAKTGVKRVLFSRLADKHNAVELLEGLNIEMIHIGEEL